MMRLVRLLWLTLRFSTRTIMALIVVLMLLFNLATLTISAVSAAVSTALSGVGITTVAAREAMEKLQLRQELASAQRTARSAEARLARSYAREAERKAAAATSRRVSHEITEGVVRRAQRRALRNSTSVFGEAIPFFGVAVITASIALEIKDACATARDMRAMQAALDADGDPVKAREQAESSFDCAKEFGDQVRVPTRAEIWEAIVKSPSQVWEAARATYDGLPDVSFSGIYERVLAGGARLMDGLGMGADEAQ